MALKIVNAYVRLAKMSPYIIERGLHTQEGALLFRFTQALNAEPPKKKKKADPKLEMMRKQRMIKRLRKFQYKMGAPEFKPIQEFTTDRRLTEESRQRDLPEVTYAENERRALLQKQWTKYKYQQHNKDMQNIELMMKSQANALEQLKYESHDLYELAMKTDENLFPLLLFGPMETPPVLDYYHECPDGEYVDVTKQYK